ncbi:MAG: GMC family oxidoreductase N-terminal domain-containing protein, partial [Jannaschia sp.]
MSGSGRNVSDVVIVGAGSAGCVLAARLSERPDLDVTILEAGGSDRSLWVHMPIGYGGAFYHPTLNWRYYTEAEPGLGGRQAYWPRGRVVGGSSSINAMVFVRGHAADYDGWAAAGCTGWSYDEVLPAFRRLETWTGGESQWRGATGPIHVRDVSGAVHPLSHAFVAAGAADGHARNPDFNGADQEGVGINQITVHNGRRSSAATAYLTPSLRRPNLRLMRDATATRILFEGRRAVGVEYLRGGRLSRVMARREVILSAGAIGSPQLLQLSGIGDPDRLGPLGIEVVSAAPAVGRNLQDHVGYDLIFEATVPTLNATLGPLWARGRAGLTWLMTRDGPLSLSVNQAGGFVRGDGDRTRPNLQLYFSPLSYTRGTPGRRRLTRPDVFPGFMIGVSNCHPKSRGWLHIRSADPRERPELHGGYYAAEGDMDEMLDAVPIMRAIAGRSELSRFIRRELSPGPDAMDRDALEAFI